MLRTSLVVVALSAVMLLTVGCGGSDRNAGSGSSALSAADYQAALKEPIDAGNRAAAAWDKKVGASNGDLSVIAGATGEYAAVEQSTADTIAALQPPNQAASAQAALVDSYHREIADLTAAKQAATMGDKAGLRAAIHKADAAGHNVDAKLGALEKAVGVAK